MDDKKSLSERDIITKYIFLAIEASGWDKHALEYAETGIENIEDMKVLTEGVENKEQVELLSKIGCEFLQGYYYSRPLPISELMGVIKNNIIKGEL